MLDAVLPLTLRDLARFRILERSLDVHFPALRTCWVIVPDGERVQLARALTGDRYLVVPESEIVPEIVNCRAAGWHKQQLIKLAMADHVASDQYLLLDADVICARPIRLADLVIGGKPRCYRYRTAVHARWYRWAQRVLHMKRSGWVHGVTPAVLDRRAVWKLASFLNDCPSRPGGLGSALIAALAFPFGSRSVERSSRWRQVLLGSLPWTEYSLYFTFLEATGQFDQYHVHSEESLYGNCVWAGQNFEHWNPLATKAGRRPPFTIVQSLAGVPPELVWQRAAPLWERKAAA